MENLVKVKKVVEYVPANGVQIDSGDVVVIGTHMIGIAAASLLGDGVSSVEVWLEGTYDVAKDANAYSQGDIAYWDNTAKQVTNTSNSGANLKLGYFDQAQLAGDTTARVQLIGTLQ